MTDSFMGIPVSGTAMRGSQGNIPQLPLEDLYPYFIKAFEAGVQAVYWDQYTPYFNDGETCYFTVNDTYMTTNPDTAKEWLSENIGDTWHYEDSSYNSEHPDGNIDVTIPVNCGSYDNALLDKFGDHCAVVVTPKQVVIFEYDHE